MQGLLAEFTGARNWTAAGYRTEGATAADAIESRPKAIARMIVSWNRPFSAPRRVRNTEPSPPNTLPKPVPFDCSRMADIKATETMICATPREELTGAEYSHGYAGVIRPDHFGVYMYDSY